MSLLFLLAGSPISARKTFPFLKVLIFLAIIIAVLTAIWFISKKIIDYKHSEKYINKQKNRLTTFKDVSEFANINNLTRTETSLLWKILSVTKTPNIKYSLTTTNDVIDTFQIAYEHFRDNNISDDDLFDFFNLEYKIELIMAKKSGMLSTRGIPLSAIVLFLSDSGEQLPLFVEKNTEDAFYMDIPEHMAKSSRKPKLFIRQRFIYKTDDGIIYNFVSRIMRYDCDDERKKYYMVVAQTDKLESESQRRFKREFCDSDCIISPVQKNKTDGKTSYAISSNTLKCNVTNISAGGCCISTKMPIKENQLLCIKLTDMGIKEPIIGIIKKTRRLPMGDFALHIQFEKISTKCKNEILTRIYKYEL